MPWGAYSNKIPRDDFLSAKPGLKFINKLVLEPKPMEFKSGKFGWQASKPNQKVGISLGGTDLDAHVMVTCKADIVSKTDLTTESFLNKNPALDISHLVDSAEPYEFQTGSFGWHSHGKQMVKVAGEELQVVVNFQAVLKGTKTGEEKSDEKGAAPEVQKDGENGAGRADTPIAVKDDDDDDEPLLAPVSKRQKT
mmetsp:Transcript_40179/g.114834  ORF Transcript_40179/g.114834 Transcript_40179/m.114834 type:complete len:195 (+) Transcript_40179:107-691(+)